MKVLHVTTYSQVCGIANYARTLIDALSAQGVDNRIFDIQTLALKECQTLEAAQAYFAPVLEQAREVDAVHIQHEFAFFQGNFDRAESLRLFGWLLGELGKLPLRVVVTFHSPIPFAGKWWQPRLNWLWRREVARHFDSRRNPNCIGLLHNHFSIDHYAKTGLDRQSLHWLPHCPEAPKAPPVIDPALTEATRQLLHYKSGDVIIGIVGFVNRVKGHFLMVEALKELPPHFKLLVVGGTSPWGSPKMENRLRATVETAGLSERIHITGMFEEADLPSYLACVDVFAAPYSRKFRSSSGAIYLALQSGKPVVASDCPSFVEINQEQPALAMFPDGNKGALIATLQRLVDSQTERDTRLTAIARYLDAHSPENAARHVMGLYLQKLPDPQRHVGFYPSPYPLPNGEGMTGPILPFMHTPRSFR